MHGGYRGLVTLSNTYLPPSRLSNRMGSKTYPLEVDETLWDKYKDTVPRSQNLDDPILEFIRGRVEEEE